MARIDATRGLAVLSGLATSLLALSSAAAQTPAQAEEGEEQTAAPAIPRLEEIVVTAQKRVGTAQDTPIALNVFTEEMLQANRIYDVGELAKSTPGFVIRATSPSNPEFVIRGIGTDDANEAGIDRSVIVYIDDVPITRPGGSNFDLFDLERVEILKGPQGTLFGRNAVGGAIRLVTRKPDAETRFSAEATVGDFDLIETRGVINHPISDQVFAKVSWSVTDRDGFNVNSVTGNRQNDKESQNVRGQIRFVPNADLDILLSGDFSSDEVEGIHSTLFPASPRFAGAGNFVPDPNLRIGSTNIDGFFDREIWGVSGQVDWTTSIGTLTSLTALRHTEFDEAQDVAGIPLTGNRTCRFGSGEMCGFESTIIADEDTDVFTQETRLASDASLLGRTLDWTFGTFFMIEDTERTQIRDRKGFGSLSRPAFIQDAQTTSVALFGQASWALTDRLNLTYGVRWTRDNKKFDVAVDDTADGTLNTLNPATEEFDVRGLEESFDKLTTDITVDYHVTDDHLLYFTARRGFKSGGFNGFAANEAEARVPVQPETAWNYELGAKTEWFDNTLQLNTSAFWIEFDGLQLRQQVFRVPGDVNTRIVAILNAATARVRGIETDLTYVPTDWLTFRFNHSFLDTEITDFGVPPSVGVIEGGDDLTGNSLSRAPENSFSIETDIRYPVGNLFYLGLQAHYSYQTFQFSELNNLPENRIDDYGILDGSISIETMDGKWKLTAWAENLNDKLTPVSIDVVNGTGLTKINDDRTFGFTLRFTY